MQLSDSLLTKQPPEGRQLDISTTKHDPQIPPFLARLSLYHAPKLLIIQRNRQTHHSARLNNHLHPLIHQPQRLLDLRLANTVHAAHQLALINDTPRIRTQWRPQPIGDGQRLDSLDASAAVITPAPVVGAGEGGLGAEDEDWATLGRRVGAGERGAGQETAAAAGGYDCVETAAGFTASGRWGGKRREGGGDLGLQF